MRTRSTFFSLALLGLALSGCGGNGAQPPPPDTTAERGIVLRLQPGVDAQALAREYGLTLEDGEPEGNFYRFRQRDEDHEDRGSISERLRRDPRFTDAEPDEGVRFPESTRVTGDPIHVPFDFVGPSDSRYVALSTDYSATSLNPTASQQLGLATTRGIKRSGTVLVAVLDTGVQASHPSLSGHLLPGYNAITPNATPEDLADGTQNQALGHGTMVAGLIAQLAPEAKILPVRVLNGDGNGTVFNVVRGLRWAVSRGASIVNLSLGSTTASRMLQTAIRDAQENGVLVVASAGNAGTEQKDYPAGFSDVIAVAAVDSRDTKASFSNFGSHITLAAPGTSIRSTYVNSTFATWSGTSFAAPLVAGAAARVCTARPGLEPKKVAELLRKSARSIQSLNPGYAGKLGEGILNIPGALAEK